MPEQDILMPGQERLEPVGQRPQAERAMRVNRGGDGPAVSPGYSGRFGLRAGVFWVAAVPAKPGYVDVPFYTDITSYLAF